MLHPNTDLRPVSEAIGLGVIANRFIPAGTITWALDPLDQVLGPIQVAHLEGAALSYLHRYTWLTGTGQRILCWDSARFMNHSCDPNTLAPGGSLFEIAVRDIQPGEELTCDYGALNIEAPFECLCGSPRCRLVVRPDDFDLHTEEWDARLRTAFPAITRLEQPLWRLLVDAESVQNAIRRPELVPSIAANRLHADIVVGNGLPAAPVA